MFLIPDEANHSPRPTAATTSERGGRANDTLFQEDADHLTIRQSDNRIIGRRPSAAAPWVRAAVDGRGVGGVGEPTPGQAPTPPAVWCEWGNPGTFRTRGETDRCGTGTLGRLPIYCSDPPTQCPPHACCQVWAILYFQTQADPLADPVGSDLTDLSCVRFGGGDT